MNWGMCWLACFLSSVSWLATVAVKSAVLSKHFAVARYSCLPLEGVEVGHHRVHAVVFAGDVDAPHAIQLAPGEDGPACCEPSRPSS